jgi:hypothetical protein
MVGSSLRENLEMLQRNAATYRTVMDRIFSDPPGSAEGERRYFFDLLICVSRLYRDWLCLGEELSSLPVERELGKARSGRSSAGEPAEQISSEVLRWDALTRQLAGLGCWTWFKREIPFSELTGLHTLDDYLHAFSLHLPEIYEETMRVERYAGMVIESPKSSVVSPLMVGLEHLARNHISFVQPALQWAADEGSWSD